MNWWKILGISGTAFCTAFLGMLTYDMFVDNSISNTTIILGAIVISSFQALLGFFSEITKQSESQSLTKTSIAKYCNSNVCKLNKVLNNMLLEW